MDECCAKSTRFATQIVVSSAHEKAHELTENTKKTRMKVRHKTKEC